jgi:hypothetical protein
MRNETMEPVVLPGCPASDWYGLKANGEPVAMTHRQLLMYATANERIADLSADHFVIGDDDPGIPGARLVQGISPSVAERAGWPDVAQLLRQQIQLAQN